MKKRRAVINILQTGKFHWKQRHSDSVSSCPCWACFHIRDSNLSAPVVRRRDRNEIRVDGLLPAA